MLILNYCHSGYDGDIVSVEADLRKGIPGIDIVGMPDIAVKESAERVRIAIKNSGLEFPKERVAVNLAPAGIKKEGASFDLSIAAAILAQHGTIKQNDFKIMILGELELSGKIRAVKGTLSAVIAGKRGEIDFFIVPDDNFTEACSAQAENIYPCASLSDAVDLINSLADHIKIKTPEPVIPPCAGEEEFYGDISDIKGQGYVKKALMTAAAGNHNIMLFGPPGSGKTMAALRFVTLLPDLGYERSLETTRIHSIAGMLRSGYGLIKRPPLRIPHHTSSLEGIIGGGKFLKPGEVSLAHNGVLFLDEAPEFRKSVLQSLREPVERHRVDLARAGRSYWYPANFQLVITANPCPCGNKGKEDSVCVCSAQEICNYWKRLGGALLDRIDIRVPVMPLTAEEMLPDADADKKNITSADMRLIINRAVEIQEKRYKGTDILRNADIPPGKINKYIFLDKESQFLFTKAVKSFSLSTRACHSVLKLARTAADIEGCEEEIISKKYLLEAVQLRRYGDSDFFWN